MAAQHNPMNDERWRRTEELFHAALDRAPAERVAFLDANCGEDSDLRQEVEVLLSKEEEAGSFLERPVIEELTASITTASARDSSPTTPRLVT